MATPPLSHLLLSIISGTSDGSKETDQSISDSKTLLTPDAGSLWLGSAWTGSEMDGMTTLVDYSAEIVSIPINTRIDRRNGDSNVRTPDAPFPQIRQSNPRQSALNKRICIETIASTNHAANYYCMDYDLAIQLR